MMFSEVFWLSSSFLNFSLVNFGVVWPSKQFKLIIAVREEAESNYLFESVDLRSY